MSLRVDSVSDVVEKMLEYFTLPDVVTLRWVSSRFRRVVMPLLQGKVILLMHTDKDHPSARYAVGQFRLDDFVLEVNGGGTLGNCPTRKYAGSGHIEYQLYRALTLSDLVKDVSTTFVSLASKNTLPDESPWSVRKYRQFNYDHVVATQALFKDTSVMSVVSTFSHHSIGDHQMFRCGRDLLTGLVEIIPDVKQLDRPLPKLLPTVYRVFEAPTLDPSVDVTLLQRLAREVLFRRFFAHTRLPNAEMTAELACQLSDWPDYPDSNPSPPDILPLATLNDGCSREDVLRALSVCDVAYHHYVDSPLNEGVSFERSYAQPETHVPPWVLNTHGVKAVVCTTAVTDIVTDLKDMLLFFIGDDMADEGGCAIITNVKTHVDVTARLNEMSLEEWVPTHLLRWLTPEDGPWCAVLHVSSRGMAADPMGWRVAKHDMWFYQYQGTSQWEVLKEDAVAPVVRGDQPVGRLQASFVQGTGCVVFVRRGALFRLTCGIASGCSFVLECSMK
eukprot:PhF_6_TR2308/c0_g2_i5/m.4062